jgi:hypothetical protein
MSDELRRKKKEAVVFYFRVLSLLLTGGKPVEYIKVYSLYASRD